MADDMQVVECVARKYALLRPHLDERQRRLLLGAEARELGRGGIKAVAEVTGVHPDTIARGAREVDGTRGPQPGVRAPGGGRKKLADTDPDLAAELKKLVDPETRGDPMSPLVWTTKSTRNLAAALTAAGMRCRTGRWPGCWPAWGSACRATPRSPRAASTKTATPSSVTSAPGSPPTLRRASRSSASTPGRKKTSGTSDRKSTRLNSS